jgi:peroxiredoxin Q/BCP
MKKFFLNIGLLLFCPIILSLAPNDRAPAFSAKNQEGKVITLKEFKGKFVLLYFYPKDDTPGCTKEAGKFRDYHDQFKKLNTVILGVSRQDEKSHQAFKAKHQLPFDLLVDEDGSLAKSFDVGLIPILGFTKRQSILIGPDGKIVHLYNDVDPETHADHVLQDLMKMKP